MKELLENQKRRENARTQREEKTVERVVVASDEGPGAGASAAETPVAAITNMAITKLKKTFIFSASIAQRCYLFFLFGASGKEGYGVAVGKHHGGLGGLI
ncbi:hypothetical protein VIGAN_04241500 [Vigna angularis var. angularis]|uniref:Uncharacterized protein n=1 Tax=Vigna angularis var. angularis TaxID=157739 RepID=A0A0S3RWG1_PHAAN|nr:hypothetical protein VIGAN_04241500 [Vigna angularis var. angularis]